MRRRALPLLAGVVLTAAAVFAVGFDGWYSFYGFNKAVVATAEVGEPAVFAGMEIAPATIAEVSSAPPPGERAAFPLPEGTRLLVARTVVTPPADGGSCGLATLIEPSSGREWTTEFSNDWENPWLSACEIDSTVPQSVGFDFVVPDDAVGPFVLTVLVTAGDRTGTVHLDVTL